MSKMKSLKPVLWLALALPACSLPEIKVMSGNNDVDGGVFSCPTDDTETPPMSTGPDGGTATGGAGGGAGGAGAPSGNMSGTGGWGSSTNTDTIITPVSCAGVGPNPNAIDRYSQGYTPDPAILDKVKNVMKTISIKDEAIQMRGLGITAFYHPVNNIQRSDDTGSIRGFRYRDASRGMNLGEDFSGTFAKAAIVNGSSVGYSTAFPVSIARGAAFDMDLEYAIGEAIGDEMQSAKETVLLAPCMNLLRHPLWGRAQEVYGEDSFETGRLASAATIGTQEHILANAKHYMAYDIENSRPSNDSQMDEQTLRETYGRHFRMVVQDAGVSSVMASYNLVNGIKATQNKHILTDVLRNDFGFRGFVLSDWWAMPNINPATDAGILKITARDAVRAGLDVELPWGLNYGQLENLVATQGSGVTKADLDVAVARILEQKFRFNADNLTGNVGLKAPKTRYQKYIIRCDAAHDTLSKKAALESMVLLKNEGVLPIKGATKIAVLGATVPYVVTDGATINGNKTRTVNFATQVLTGDLGSSRVFHNPMNGVSPFDGLKNLAPDGVSVVSGETAQAAADADFIVVVAGLTPEDEGEEYTLAGDRYNLSLDGKQKDPKYAGIQNKLIADAAALKKPMVVVLIGGSVIDMPWLSNVPAVVMAWYPGQGGGDSLARLLYGTVKGQTYNFSGKLPFTWGHNLDEYPQFNAALDSSKGGSTTFDYYAGYGWFDHQGTTPLFPFGYGLSYTKFEYSNLQLGCSDMSKGAVMPVAVNVTNKGTVPGDEIVLLWASFPGTKARRYAKQLKGFARVSLNPGETKQVTIPVRLADLDYFQMDSPTANTGKWVVETGDVKIMVGGSSTTNTLLSGTVKVNGYESAAK